MAIREILNIASEEKEQEAVQAEDNYESGLFGLTARQVKEENRNTTMNMLRMGIQGGLNPRAVGAGVLLGQGLRKLTGKESQDDLDLKQREANREAFYHQLQSSTPVELLELSKKLISSEDAQSRSMGMSLMTMARSDIAAATANATAAGKVEPKNINAGQVKVATGVLEGFGLTVGEGDTSMQNFLASEYNRNAAIAEANGTSRQFYEKTMAEHMAEDLRAKKAAGEIEVNKVGVPFFRQDQVTLNVDQSQQEQSDINEMSEFQEKVNEAMGLYN